MKRPVLLLCAVAFLLAPAILYPNVFGNQPDAIADESYFLTSALQSIEKKTLPGWEFSASGAYYGGVQAYLDTAVLIPVIGVQILLHRGSLEETKSWVALHTGELVHFLRLVNGVVFLGTLFFLAWYFLKRAVPRPLLLQLILLGALLLGNSLIIMLAHTAKVWILYLVFEIVAGSLVLAQEYFYRQRREAFIKTPYYVGLLLWLTALAFFQTFVGLFSTGLWLIWAWWLGHFRLSDAGLFVKRNWYLFVVVALTQTSFIWRAFIDRPHGSLLDFQGANLPGSSPDWGHRFLAPLYDATFSQPFILLYVVAAFLLVTPLYRGMLDVSNRYLAIALMHPLIVYLIFYPLLGFDLAPRYALMLTVACSFSVVMLLPRKGGVYWGALFSSGILALAVLLHATMVYWTPGYQLRFSTELERNYNDQKNTLVVDPSAVALQLPMNALSLQNLDSIGKSMGRYAFLLSRLDAVEKEITFKPLVIYTRSPEARDSSVAEQQKLGKHVFILALPEGVINTAEPDTLPVFFATKTPGFNYIVQSASAQ